jgi:hypothetical protein
MSGYHYIYRDQDITIPTEFKIVHISCDLTDWEVSLSSAKSHSLSLSSLDDTYRVACDRALRLFLDPAVREDCGDALLPGVAFLRSLWLYVPLSFTC